ncbi:MULTISPECIES: hypothetical protein [Xanthomonas]|uniref:Uncharacterized protein n=1 Tax=Xanthomonas cucurbitae TaxID=56453 RepID=A0ABY7Y9W2_9XANT|nr:hypothetical protein [Xanthomonas cucurbitae]WDM66744.1 hypothetical protein K6981_14635 [Xanthomonas cucurbitae]WDM70621.1 hypothetical protein K6978_14605 [Xanthomonas cucurbitae]WDM74489.1 hypothetical protein K6982_13920 [Xanthomonas cucurbitae]
MDSPPLNWGDSANLATTRFSNGQASHLYRELWNLRRELKAIIPSQMIVRGTEACDHLCPLRLGLSHGHTQCFGWSKEGKVTQKQNRIKARADLT